MTSLVLGLDPGQHGAAALVGFAAARPTVRMWWAWTKMRGKTGGYRLRRSNGGGSYEEARVQSMHEVGELIAQQLASHGWTNVLVAVEGLYIGGGRTKAQKAKRQSTLVTAELAGEIIGPLRRVGNVVRYTWTAWAKVIGLTSAVGAKHATALCIQESKRRASWPEGYPGAVLNIENEGALAEAAFIAIHADRHR